MSATLASMHMHVSKQILHPKTVHIKHQLGSCWSNGHFGRWCLKRLTLAQSVSSRCSCTRPCYPRRAQSELNLFQLPHTWDAQCNQSRRSWRRTPLPSHLVLQQHWKCSTGKIYVHKALWKASGQSLEWTFAFHVDDRTSWCGTSTAYAGWSGPHCTRSMQYSTCPWAG